MPDTLAALIAVPVFYGVVRVAWELRLRHLLKADSPPQPPLG